MLSTLDYNNDAAYIENEPTPFRETLWAIRDVAGSWRSLERYMRSRKAGTLSSQYLAELANGDKEPSYESVEKLAKAFPEFAEKLFTSIGKPVPEEFVTPIPPEILQAQKERAQWMFNAEETIARRRNLPQGEVVFTLLHEELQRGEK